jgi:hypothetical protein
MHNAGNQEIQNPKYTMQTTKRYKTLNALCRRPRDTKLHQPLTSVTLLRPSLVTSISVLCNICSREDKYKTQTADVWAKIAISDTTSLNPVTHIVSIMHQDHCGLRDCQHDLNHKYPPASRHHLTSPHIHSHQGFGRNYWLVHAAH